MRKIDSSGKASCRVALSERADARSRPKGFSSTTRACPVRPQLARPLTTFGKALGGIAR